jgi:murein DD-endopeptidase MepM/ murein hydrolase activator NlpD
MNKTVKVIIATILCSNLITSSVLANDLGSKKEESNKIKQEISNSKDKVKELENSKNDILKDLQIINNNIGKLEKEVDNLNFDINKATKTIVELEEKSEELRLDLEKNKEIMDKRLRALYMSQGQGYVEVLFESKGVADFIEKLEVITTLVKYDKGVMDEFKTSQQQLDNTLKEVAVEKESLEGNRAVVLSKVDELSVIKNEKDSLMAKAQEDIETQEKVLAQQEDEYQQIASIITQMEAAQRPSRGGSGNSGGGQVSNGKYYSITGGTRYSITSGYGWRSSPVGRGSEFHPAIDIGAPHGSGVYSLMGGTVAYSGWMNGYGNVVVVNHGGISTLYAHNSQLLVSVGQQVQGGEKISLVGSTGWSTGPHIHFEVRDSSGEKMDPTSYYIY